MFVLSVSLRYPDPGWSMACRKGLLEERRRVNSGWETAERLEVGEAAESILLLFDVFEWSVLRELWSVFRQRMYPKGRFRCLDARSCVSKAE